MSYGPGTTIRHNGTGKMFVVIGSVQVRIASAWIEHVLVTAMDGSGLYARMPHEIEARYSLADYQDREHRRPR